MTTSEGRLCFFGERPEQEVALAKKAGVRLSRYAYGPFERKLTFPDKESLSEFMDKLPESYGINEYIVVPIQTKTS